MGVAGVSATMRRLGSTLLVALLAVACGGSGGSDGPGVSDVDASGVWRLESGRSASGEIETAQEWRITFEVEDDAARGSAGCNSYGGGVSIDGDSFDAGSFAVSEIGCPAPVAEAEARFLEAMDAADTIAVEDDTLTLTGPGTELVFRRVPPARTKSLTKTTWILDSLVDGPGSSSTVSSARPARLRFGGQGTFEGSTGCRSFSGSWTAPGDVLTATGITFEGTCKGAVRRQDSHVIAVLGAGFRARVEGDRLTLTAARGSFGLVYRAQ
ncbi:MAG TPA: META domain-containing protein [Actinomycetota bacterium]|nr:META domain-containing protein [Actinomycetota bacterium]